MPEINRVPKRKREITDRARERQEVYNTPIWKRMQRAKLMECPLCESCLLEGKTTPSKQVHHIVSFMNYEGLKRQEVAYNYGNLIALCIECHTKKHNKKKDK